MRTAAFLVLISLTTIAPASAGVPCGFGPGDWCPAPAGDLCGRHRTAAECKADKACYGMEYRGESVVACRFDDRGFASNCPTVGCTSQRPGQKDKKGEEQTPKN
jgi:hypothetical protein